MKKINIIKESSDFSKILNLGKRVRNNLYIIYYNDKEEKYHRFGLSVGKKISNKAVIRNKLKRRLKNIIDNNDLCYQKDKDYIIIMKESCKNSTYKELEDGFLNLMIKLKENNNEKK